MRPVPIQPKRLEVLEFTKSPMIFLSEEIRMMTTIRTGAMMPFKTAAKNKALMGFTPKKFKSSPTIVEKAMIR